MTGWNKFIAGGIICSKEDFLKVHSEPWKFSEISSENFQTATSSFFCFRSPDPKNSQFCKLLGKDKTLLAGTEKLGWS